MATRKDLFIKNVSEQMKSRLFQLAYKNGYSLQEYCKMVLRDHLHKKFPDLPIE